MLYYNPMIVLLVQSFCGSSALCVILKWEEGQTKMDISQGEPVQLPPFYEETRVFTESAGEPFCIIIQADLMPSLRLHRSLFREGRNILFVLGGRALWLDNNNDAFVLGPMPRGRYPNQGIS